MAYRSVINIGDGVGYEAVALAAITPGQLVELLSTGKIQKQATAKANIEKAVAVEDYNQGNDMDDVYAAAATVMYRVFQPGDTVILILADGGSVAIGGEVEAALLGEVQALTSAGTNPIGVAMEAVDASNSAVTAIASRRVRVRLK